MNVRCPSCQTVFRVDPERVPVAGIKARCAKCAAVFQLNKSGVMEAALQPVAAPPAPQPVTQPVAPPLAAAPPPPPPPPPPPIAQPEVAAPPPPAPAMPAATATATSGAKRPSFRNQDPQARAQRIARALVSDIVAYNKGKLKEQLDAARLRTEFREEIRKSWEEYVEQVGLDMAKSTPYFRDSLNEILAKGQKVF